MTNLDRPVWSVRTLLSALLIIGGLAVCPAHGEITVSPQSVTFNSMDEVAAVGVSSGGGPVVASHISGWSLLASGHRYDHMLNVETKDGVLSIRPSDKLEAGTYELAIETTDGSATVTVFAPLRSLKSVVEQKAEAMGITIPEAKARLGLQHTMGVGVIDLNLPPVYSVGQTLRLELPPADAADFSWLIDGEVVKQGKGANTFAYTFPDPGDYIVSVRQFGEGIKAEGSALVTVAVPPSVGVTAKRNQELRMHAPEGYDSYRWEIDGEYAGGEQILMHKFRGAGTYEVEARGSTTVSDSKEFGLVRYRVEVQ